MQSVKHIDDILNYKFDDLLKVMDETLDELNNQAPTTYTYDNLTKVININLEKSLRRLGILKNKSCLHQRSGHLMQDGEKVILVNLTKNTH